MVGRSPESYGCEYRIGVRFNFGGFIRRGSLNFLVACCMVLVMGYIMLDIANIELDT